MKRSAYEEWNELQESAKDLSKCMYVPRRKCTIETKPAIKKPKLESKDSISSELGKKDKKIKGSHKEAAKHDEAPCKRKLEFEKVAALKGSISNGKTAVVEAKVSSPEVNGSTPVTDNDKQEDSSQSTSPEANGGSDVPQKDETAKQESISSSNENELTPPVVKSNYSLPENDSGTEDSERTPTTAMAKLAIGAENDGEKRTFRVRDLVFGKLKGYDWWPGLIITYREARQRPALEGCFWVRWFGDHKVSEVLSSNLASLFNFKLRFTSNRMRGIYKKGIKEALELAAKRSSKIGLPIGGTKEAEDSRLESLLQWANDSFAPLGMDGLKPKYIENDDSSSSDEEDEPESKPKLDHHKHHPIRHYRSNNKDRFGKPMTNPTLAEDVKGLFDEAAEGKRSIENLCLGCGDTKIAIGHPLFEGGLCEECKDSFCEGSYLFDEDGSQMYCSICSDGKEVLMCDSPGCCRSYCGVCIDMLCGVGTAVKIASQENWKCFMCSGESIRLLKRRPDWQERLREMFLSDDEDEYPPLDFVPPVPLEERKPVRVLALFDGIASGLVVLKELELEIDLYIASEIDENAMMVAKVKHEGYIKQLGNVQHVTEKMIDELGPFDVVLGGSPCNDLSIANPLRKGIYEGTGRLFFEFFRILMYCRPPKGSTRPFFWLFENVVGMRHEDKRVISRFLQCNPTMIDAKDVSAQHRARYFWGNIPGMNRPACPLPGDTLELQEVLEPSSGRLARFTKVRTITTRSNSLKQTKEAVMPVEVLKDDGKCEEDVLWCTEVERLFGFPEHYTDVANMGKSHRQKLLGSAWSIPVLRHLLAPLRDYFKCSRVNKQTQNGS